MSSRLSGAAVLVWSQVPESLDRKEYACVNALKEGAIRVETGHCIHCEVKKTEDPDSASLTTVICRGQLVASTANAIRNTVKPLIAAGGPIVLDLTGIDFIDSMGLGVLVALKASAINTGNCTLRLGHLSEKIQDVLKMTNLTELFRS